MDPQAKIYEQTSLARAIVERIDSDSDSDDRGRLSLRTADQLPDLGDRLAEGRSPLTSAAGRRL